MSFNTIYSDLICPFCHEKVSSGVGFRLGTLAGTEYQIGDTLKWDGTPCRPSAPPPGDTLVSVGYFNCDNIRCTSWQDCYPDVQQALVTVKNGVITDVCVLHERKKGQNFDIVEPEGLS